MGLKRLIFGMIGIGVCCAVFALSVNMMSGAKISYVNSAKVKNIVKKTPILIDAGHGGVDGGAVAPSDKTVEKGLNLEIAKKLCDIMKLMGYSVTMTRQSDISIHDDTAKNIRQKKVSDLKNRLKMLENSDCEMLVSIHMNIFSQSKYSGTQVFYGGQNEASRNIAEFVRQSVHDNLQPSNDRAVKKSTKSIYLLYNATKPAIMAECGFLSNTEELCKLKSDEYQRKIALCIANGVIKYKFSEV